MSLTLKQYIDGVTSGKLQVESVVAEYLDKAENSVLKNENAFVRIHRDYVKNNLDKIKNSPLK